jgi:HPt (histidine-containing phosphotransfer) domain-containing protein
MVFKRMSLRAFAAAPEQGGADGVVAAVLDAAALDKLRELDPTGQNHLIERVVKAFDGSISRLLSQLKESQGSSDLMGVRHVAHTLKSSSASIGALKLSQICADIESMVRQSRTEGLDERLADMNSEIVKVQAALRLLAGGQP